MTSRATSPIIGVHLDLKGIMFRPGYIPQLLGDLASQGVNAILLEYEDVFPFTGIEVAWDPAAVWSRRTIALLRKECARHGMEIIPLQQCLGHLEWVFRWSRYAHFAEDLQYPSTLCLTNLEGKALVRDMLHQIMDAHPESRYVHLGMDEAHALTIAAERTGRSVLDLFIDYLMELIEVVEAHGKTPVIWSDMLEDHFQPGYFDRIKDRVVLCPWDYSTTTPQSRVGRIRGHCVSRAWLEEPENPDAPAIHAGTQFFEELPDTVQALIAPYRHAREIDSFFQVDFWTALGFRVLGASCVRDVSQDCILPNYLVHEANIRQWSKVIQRNRQLGVIATSWSRGNTFCPPTYPMDVFWPCVTVLGEAMGSAPAPFFPGVPEAIVQLLLRQLSRSLRDWAIEGNVCDAMEALLPQLTAHQYEWRSLILLGRVYALHRQVQFAIAEVDYFRAAGRPVALEWQRRLDEQQRLKVELATLRQEVKSHFGRRCHGRHFTEWLDHLFTVPTGKLTECRKASHTHQQRAIRRYGW